MNTLELHMRAELSPELDNSGQVRALAPGKILVIPVRQQLQA